MSSKRLEMPIQLSITLLAVFSQGRGWCYVSEGFVCIIVFWQGVDGESAEPIPSAADVILDQSNSFNAILYCMVIVDNH